jgi:hypothetical protein
MPPEAAPAEGRPKGADAPMNQSREAHHLDGTIGEILTLWSFRPPMGQRRSPAIKLTDPPMMTTPNRYDNKACDSTARRIRGSRTVVSDTW